MDSETQPAATGPGPAPGQAPARTRQPFERFDFGDAGHVTNEQLRLLRSLDELLARNLMHALSAWLRISVLVEVAPQEQQPFQEFLEKSEEGYLLTLHLPELHAGGLLRWPLQLATYLIELQLGGTGSMPSTVRELTEIEDAVFGSVLQVAVRELNTVWATIGLSFEQGERARNGQERQMMAPSERVFCFTYQLQIGDAQGEVCLCLPAPVLASCLRRAAGLRKPARVNAEAETQALLTSVRDARVRAGLCFPPVRMPAFRLRGLVPGGTLVLPLPANAPAEFRVSDVPIASAVPVRVGERRAVRISGNASVPTLPDGSVHTTVAEAVRGEQHG